MWPPHIQNMLGLLPAETLFFGQCLVDPWGLLARWATLRGVTSHPCGSPLGLLDQQLPPQ